MVADGEKLRLWANRPLRREPQLTGPTGIATGWTGDWALLP